MIKKFPLLFAASCLFFCNLILATLPQSFANTTPNTLQESLQKIEATLNAHKTAKGTFHQTNPNGTTTKGIFYLKRPHHMKFAYDTPKGHFIMAKKGWLMIHDPEFDEDSFVELEYTPAKFFLKENIALTDDIKVVGFKHSPHHTLLTLRDADAQAEIALSFDSQTYALQGWMTRDAQGEVTTVHLKDMVYGIDIPSHTFKHRKKIRKWDD